MRRYLLVGWHSAFSGRSLRLKTVQAAPQSNWKVILFPLILRQASSLSGWLPTSAAVCRFDTHTSNGLSSPVVRYKERTWGNGLSWTLPPRRSSTVSSGPTKCIWFLVHPTAKWFQPPHDLHCFPYAGHAFGPWAQPHFRHLEVGRASAVVRSRTAAAWDVTDRPVRRGGPRT